MLGKFLNIVIYISLYLGMLKIEQNFYRKDSKRYTYISIDITLLRVYHRVIDVIYNVFTKCT